MRNEPSNVASSASPRSALLYLENITKSYGALQVLRNVTIEVQKG
jgi:ABC-type sugar transport system ATPase subunit